jgi:hypothetical protein
MTKGFKQKEQLSSDTKGVDSFFYLSEVTQPQDKVSNVEVLRVGKIYHGNVEITSKMLDDYVKNFQNNVYGTDLQVNLTHRRGDEAAGWIKNLYRNGDKLMATIEWTELGEEKISKKIFRYVSSELGHIKHHLTGKLVKNVFVGLGLTNTPAMKGQVALALSEDLELQFNKSKMDKKNIKLEEVNVEAKEADTPQEEVQAEETTTEDKEVVETKEEKKEEAQEASETEETPTEEAAEESEAKELSEDASLVTLAEFTKLQEECLMLKEKLEAKELNESIDSSLMLSSDNKVGFVKDQREDVFNFMLTLTEEQRAKFIELAGNVRTVELGEKGSSKKMEPKTGTFEDQVVERTKELMDKDKDLSLADAQKRAIKEIRKNK